MSRIENSLRNIMVGGIGLFAGYLLNFIARRIFVHYLSIEYLGLNGLFYNIFYLLSFAELGIGTALTYSLYKPLAKNDSERVHIIVSYFRKTNFAVGAFIIFVGVGLTPFLGAILKEAPDIPNLNLFYLLYIADVGLGYFLSYKRILLLADQRKYIDTMYTSGFEIIKYSLQIIILIITKSYIFYLGVAISVNVAENLSVTAKINSLYPYLKKPTSKKLPKDEIKTVLKNVVALISQKVGEIIVNGTDNILIVRFVDLASAGIYGGYYMVVIAISNVIGMFNRSILASIGNLVVEENEDTHFATFLALDFILAWIVGFCAISLFVLLNLFISLWLGEEYVFSIGIVFIIVLNFYVRRMLGSMRTFYSSMGLFWHDRYKALFEAGINLFVSIILAKQYGIIGIFIGTVLSTLLTCSWYEPYILFKHGLKKPVRIYFQNFLLNITTVGLAGWITQYFVNLITVSSLLLRFVISVVICATIPNFLFLVLMGWRKDFGIIINSIKEYKKDK